MGMDLMNGQEDTQAGINVHMQDQTRDLITLRKLSDRQMLKYVYLIG